MIKDQAPEEILALPAAGLEALVLTDMPLVLRIGSAELLGQFHLQADYLVVELA